MNAHRRAIAAVLALAGLFGAACAGPDQEGGAEGRASVRVVYVPVGTLLPAFVAQDTGIFDRHRLAVTLTPIQNVSTVPGTLGRQFDLGGVTPPDLIKAASQGIEVSATSSATVDTEENPIGQLVVPANSPIRTVADLRGRRVGTPSVGATMHVSLLNWLQQEGVDGGAVTAVEMPFSTMADQLAAGRVDAVEAVEPFLSLLLRAGNRAIGAPVLTIAEPPVVSVVWIAQRRWAQDNADTVTRWNAALVEAEQFIESDEPRAREILRKYTELPEEVARSAKLPTYSASTPPSELGGQLASWVAALRRVGQLTGDVPADTLVFDPAVR